MKKTKPPTFLLALTFLFFFSGSVYGEEEVKKEYYDNGKLKSEIPHNGLGTGWYETGEKIVSENRRGGCIFSK